VDRVLRGESARGLYPVEPKNGEPEYLECPRIIPDDLWKRVQRILNNSSRGRGPESAHPFTGILRCACGEPMHVASSSPKYACATCENRIPVADIEKVVLGEVSDFLEDRSEPLNDMLAASAELLNEQEALAKHERELQRIAAEIQKAERLCMENRIPVEQFDRMNRNLIEQQRALNREINKTGAKAKRLKEKGSSTKPPSLDTSSLLKSWPSMSAKAKRAIIQTLFERIVVGPDEVEFIYPFPLGFSQERAKPRHSARPTKSTAPTVPDAGDPLYIRLPKPGQLCPRTGLSRAKLNELIIPSDKNNWHPPVESKSLRKREGGRGSRLIVWGSLRDYLENLGEKEATQ
jgi:hypothetical protein